MATDLRDAITENAQGPKTVTVDGVTVTQHSPKEVAEADRYTKSVDATKKAHRGLRFTKLVPPGTA